MKTQPKPFRTITWILLAIIIVAAYVVSIRVTNPDVVKLVTSAPKAGQILSQLLTPDLTTRDTELSTISIAVPIPCDSAPLPEQASSGPRLLVTPGCVSDRETFTLQGLELAPNSEAKVAWNLPGGNQLSIKRVQTDAEGNFSLEIQARPIAATKDGTPSVIEVETAMPVGARKLSQAAIDVLNAMVVTIFMALLATTIGTIIAIPLSFLAARNITRRGPVGTVIYYITRSILNIIRSYEPLVMATIFALIIGFGSPFAGVLALVIVTTASLGKMFSESIEGIDPGPIEAITATGANRPQVIFYSVVPQIIPDFLSFIIYHWDINVRISTIIGFVGGGGIGYYLIQRINTFEYHKAGTALLAIIIVVWVLDFFSSEVRKKLT